MQPVVDNLERLEKALGAEQIKLVELERRKEELQQELANLESNVEETKAVMTDLQAKLEERQIALEKVKKSASKASKHYDRAIREIAQLNDMIEKLSSERYSIFKKCSLDEIDLPLKSGSLERLPAEEVRIRAAFAELTLALLETVVLTRIVSIGNPVR